MTGVATLGGQLLANGSTRIPLRRLLAYALIEFPVGGAMNAMSLFLGFHYATLGVDLAQIGLIMMVARLLDVLIDPAVGMMSDRTRAKWGRRKVWVVAGAPVFVLAREADSLWWNGDWCRFYLGRDAETVTSEELKARGEHTATLVLIDAKRFVKEQKEKPMTEIMRSSTFVLAEVNDIQSSRR